MPSVWSDVLAYVPGMLILLLFSSFFSGSEAAYFSLTLSQRGQLARGNSAERIAFALLKRSERLLMGILLWNLAINLAYFSLVSRASLEIESAAHQGDQARTVTAILSIGSLLVIILFGEFLPKSIAVLHPLPFVRFTAIPLTLAIRLVDVLLPMIRFANEFSRRVVWPGLKPEPYLEVSDLDRAIELSSEDSRLYEQERQVLRNVIQLSDIRVEEWMRPRTQYRIFQPPIDMQQLGGEITPSGYMLVTDDEGQEIISAIDLRTLVPGQMHRLSSLQQPLVIVPWCASVADALKKLRETKRRVAMIVNEFGETIGVLTLEEIFEAVLQVHHVGHGRQFTDTEIHQQSPGVWMATGITKLRMLERALGRRLNTSKNLTVAGAVQEQLRRLAETGDVCEVDGLRIEVVQAGARGESLVRIIDERLSEGEQKS